MVRRSENESGDGADGNERESGREQREGSDVFDQFCDRNIRSAPQPKGN